MPLKRYQEKVIREVREFLRALAAEQVADGRHPSLDAWKGPMRQKQLRPYNERVTGDGRDLPSFCVQVPTGGGKTLLATQFLGLVYETILKNRSGAGLVLWVVPSDQIYKDTLKALKDRRHFYRESLEYAVSRRVEVWEKHEIATLTPGQLASNLNILLIKLQGTNRQDKESLKFFRDSGGNIVMHFPPENEHDKHRELKERITNLEMLEANEETGSFLVKTSLANLVRQCRPPVILDEGHKATSDLARETVEGFNPAVVIELSATPPSQNNILVRVTGQELLEEEMIKLPINVAASGVKAWKDCLAQARDKRRHLAELARQNYAEDGRLIRPIVLVQVERTGKDQREAGLVHSEAAKDYLIQNLGVPESAIAIKSSARDDIEGIDLMDENCPVEWIITKAALQEGWDCPFAYILVSLNNTASRQSMTQLVGRVLRQPYQTRTPYDELNESYIYCRHLKASTIAAEVKKALEKEGYEGSAASVVDQSDGSRELTRRPSRVRDLFRHHYQEFEGKIYLPRFCVRSGRNEYEKLDWYRHLLAAVDVGRFDYPSIDWDLSAELAAAKEYFYRIHLGSEQPEKLEERDSLVMEPDASVSGWLIANLPFDYFGFRERRTIVEESVAAFVRAHPDSTGKLGLVKYPLRQKIVGFVERETDQATEAAFKQLFDSQRLCFYLECVECRHEIPAKVDVRVRPELQHNNGDRIMRSLFDFVPADLNDYEKSVALYIDRHPQVLWWYRNLVGPGNFAIQGFRRGLIYPDFVVQGGRDTAPTGHVLVVESKGAHLKGNEDTSYKRAVAQYFQRAGHSVPWQKLGEEFAGNQFRFQILDEGDYADRDWQDDLKRQLDAMTRQGRWSDGNGS